MKKLIFAFFVLISLSFSAQKIQNKIVDAACGKCIFKLAAEKDCSMYVKIGGQLYPVIGISEKSFGDAHS